jgi:2-polyprenyl-6-methoxyphenol hydroxylase-like FAD-dependent oxidoreductase
VADRYDVAVVGGRVGGATLATLLAQRGLSVLLLDKASFPSDTFSTHVVYGDSFGVWQEMGAWPRIEAIGATPLVAIDWRRRPPNASVHGAFLPVNGHPYAMCIRRLLLDEVLWEHAAATPGVTALPKAFVREVLWDDGRSVGLRFERVEGSRRRPETARAALVVGADGRFSLVAASVGAHEYNVVPPIWFPFYSYLRDVEPIDPPVLEIVDGETAGGVIMLCPCDDGIWLGVIYTPQQDYEEFRRDHARIFWDRLRSEPTLAGRLAGARRIAPVRGRGDIVNFMRTAAGPGWALVGDAGQHKDPLYGQGIGDAVRTARLLADHALRAFGGEQDWRAALAEFHAYRDLDLLPNYDWMIKGRPQGWEAGELDRFLAGVGGNPELSRRFVNLFSHGVTAAELFGPETLAAFRKQDVPEGALKAAGSR